MNKQSYLEASIGLPISRVDLANAANKQFQFPLVKRTQ